ncbi:MAG: tetratricopeptide repeat protein [Acidobacteriaceae bacterium]|nr:tetratricopeptide repeat protein [Acidobacteriaceae bacterium]MBV8572302.1 tetratricopeptide repeat protein [Acidobacteriaceae bacterium]
MKLPLRPEIEEAFAAALDLPREQQKAFLAREYQDSQLRAEVESLLCAYEAADTFLEPNPGKRRRTINPESETQSGLPPALGEYRIIRLLGEGGMGAVYEAEQNRPRRTVALKILKHELSSPELRWRFEQEAHVLGRLQHPCIARIYQAGTAQTPFGSQPYFAMELIKGPSLLQYAEARRLNIRQRLEIMLNICDAVHHAHQVGVIHRDLKPGNILVEESGQPKVLDFGVARVVEGDLQNTRHTGSGEMLGTLAYMSPEQVMGDPFDLDTRSDVYALGVILFELLSGRLPYQLSRQFPEAIETILQRDPTPLSSIARACRGDLETIVGKALAKDKSQRYSSVADLGADLQRYLRKEPIIARRPTPTYRISKFVSRHRALVASVTAIFLVLISGIAVAGRQAAIARRAELIAITERNRAIEEKGRADSESAAAKAITNFLRNDVLAQASANVQAGPATTPDPNLTVRTALDRAASRIDATFKAQPLIEASIRQTIGKAYQDLGLYPEADRQLQRALAIRNRILGEHHPDSLTSIHELAGLYHAEGKYAQAEPLFARALEARRRLLGEDNPATLESMNGLAAVYFNEGKLALSEPLYLNVVNMRRRVLGEDHPDTLLSMNDLARLYLEEGKYAQAALLCPKVVAARERLLGQDHPDTLISEDNLGRLYLSQGKYADAEPLFSKVLRIRQRVLGEQHPDTLISMNNLAVVYRKEGKFQPAESLLKQALEIQRRRLGEDNPDTLLMMNNLARAYMDEGRYAQAEPLFTKVLSNQRRLLGEQHPDTLVMMRNLARLYHCERKSSQAEALLHRVMLIQRSLLGADHPDTLTTMSWLAHVYLDEREYGAAESLYREVFETRRRTLGSNHRDTASALASMGELRLRQRRFAEAERLLRDAFESQTRNHGETWERYKTQTLLGASLAAQAKFEQAEPFLISGFEGLSLSKGAVPWESRSVIEEAGQTIVHLYQDSGQPGKAAQWLDRLQTASDPAHE